MTAVEDSGVVLRLAAGRYAVPMSSVAEVTRLSAASRVPGAPGWLFGLANWRGRVLPLLDLRVVLGLDRPEIGPTGRVVVVSAGGVSVGLLAESVEGLVALSADRVAPPPATLPVDAAGLVAGQVSDGTGPIAVVAVDAVLQLRELLPG